MEKRGRKILTGLLAALLVLATHPVWLPLPARFLVAEDNLKKADAIIVLSGDWRLAREAKAVELYKAGYADRIVRVFEKENRGFEIVKELLGSAMTQEEAYKRYFAQRGVPEGSIVLGEADATSTFDELKAMKGIASRNNFKSLILVTGDYHMRRALMTARWVFRSAGITVHNVSVYSENFCPDRWWLHEEDIKGVVLEYLSAGFYVTYHFMLGR